MKSVSERPPLPQTTPSTFAGLLQFTQDIVKQLITLLTEYGYRLNRVLPKDGSEPMTGDLDMGGNAILDIDWAGSDDGAGSGLDADTVDGAHVGTSGATVGLLNAAKTDSGANIFSVLNRFTSGFNSYDVAIADDAVLTITTSTTDFRGILAITSSSVPANARINGFIHFRTLTGQAPYAIALERTTNISLTNGSLTGTTGVDGNSTLSIMNNRIYIENRSGANIIYTLTFLNTEDGVVTVVA